LSQSVIRSSLAAAVAASTLAAAAAIAAEGGVWVSSGPPGAGVYCIAPAPSSPSTVYVGTGRGVWRGDRGGALWQSASAGLPVDRVQAIAVDPIDASTLYAGTVTPSDGTPSEGIFKSTDGGATWFESNDGLVDLLTRIEPLDVASLSIDPSNPQIILAGTRFSEIFRSTDGGATWTPRTLGGFGLGLETTGFARDPGNPQRVYAASTRGLLLSIDGGESWGSFGDAGISFYSIAFDPASPSTVYAGNVTGFGLGKSLDGGATWSAANGNLPRSTIGGSAFFPAILSVAVDPSAAGVYITTQGNGVFKSTDGGGSWTPVDAGLNELFLRSIAFLPGSPTTILAGGNGGGVYRSTDGATTWSTSSFGLEEALVSAVAANPGRSGRVYASAFDGVWATADGAGSWRRASGGLPPEPVASLALRFAVSIQPGDEETLFAGTLGAGLHASTDGGATWSPRATGLADDYVSAVTIDPTNSLTLYAGTDHPYDGSNPQRVYKSTDAGVTWRQTGLDAAGLSIGVIAVDPDDASRVGAVSRGILSYFQSVDGGNSWTTVTPGADSGCGGINTIRYEKSGSGILLGVTNGVCRSTDGGATWTRHGVVTLGSVYDLLVDPVDSSIVYAAVSPLVSGGTGGVFVSSDGGVTWSALGTGLATFAVRSLAVDASRETLYAGILRGGVAGLALEGPQRAGPQPPPLDRQTHVVPPR
jgi:hypothetical protein